MTSTSPTETRPSWALLDAERGLLRAEYTFGEGGSATTVAFRLADGGLALLSPPGGPRAGALYDALRAYGEVTAAIAPNGQHRLGMPEVEARYPQATLYAPEGALRKVAQRVRAAGRLKPLSALPPHLPPEVEVFVPPHMKRPDTLARFQTTAGPLWLITDLYTNLVALPPNPAFRVVLWALGFRTGLAVNLFACRHVLVDNPPAFSAWMQDELVRHPPAGLIPGHGPVLSRAAVGGLGPLMQAAIPRLSPSGA